MGAIVLKRGVTSHISSEPITDGAILVDTTKKEIYTDIDAQHRIQLNGRDLTLAQYNALSQEEQNNGTYYITDVENGETGHTILDASGASMTKEESLQFKTAKVTDENGVTVVRNVVSLTKQQYEAITPIQGVIYEITDESVTPVTGAVLTQTLAVGATTVTFTDALLTPTALVDIYTNVFGVNPTDVDASVNGRLVLTFDEQETAVSVKIVVREG